MAKVDKAGITINEARWSPNRQTSVPIRLADNGNLFEGGSPSTALPIFYFPGYALHTGGMRRILSNFAEEGHHVIGVDLPFTDRALRGKRNLVVQLAREGPHEVAAAFRKGPHSKEPIRALGHSKGASVVGRAINEDHTDIGDIILLQPPELQRAAPLTVSEREERRLIRKFVRDMTLSGLDQEGNLAEIRGDAILLKTFLTDQLIGQFPVMVGTIVTGSVVEPLLEHVQAGNTVQTVMGDNDQVFPPLETVAILEMAAAKATIEGVAVKDGGRLVYSIVPGVPHLNGDAPQGMRLLNFALGTVENPKGPEIQEIQIYPIPKL